MKLILSFLLVTSHAWASNSRPAVLSSFDHSHTKLDSVLKNYSSQKDGQTWVDYNGLKQAGRAPLKEYLQDISSVSGQTFKTFTDDQRLAFLINAYNAFTLEWILLHHPVKSIKDTGSLLSSPWKKKFPGYKLLGESFTLDKIEHVLIRKEFKEPRIHFAVNCASIGCPSLRPSAYTAANLATELSEVEEAFFKNPGKFYVKNKTAFLSSILDWYGGDFEDVYGSLESYIQEKSQLYGVSGDLPPGKFEIDYIDYDWSLNGK